MLYVHTSWTVELTCDRQGERVNAMEKELQWHAQRLWRTFNPVMWWYRTCFLVCWAISPFDMLIRIYFLRSCMQQIVGFCNLLAVAPSLSFQMAWPYYDGMRNTTPNPHCSALSVFPRQQSPTIWKALIPPFLSLSSNGFLLCPSPISFLSFSNVSLFILRHFFF